MKVIFVGLLLLSFSSKSQMVTADFRVKSLVLYPHTGYAQSNPYHIIIDSFSNVQITPHKIELDYEAKTSFHLIGDWMAQDMGVFKSYKYTCECYDNEDVKCSVEVWHVEDENNWRLTIWYAAFTLVYELEKK